MIIRDGSAWPGAVLQRILSIPAVTVLPFPMFQPAGYHFMGTPDPVAYAPQALWGKTPRVCCGTPGTPMPASPAALPGEAQQVPD